jgi:pyrimidine deaminase RibD-like protein
LSEGQTLAHSRQCAIFFLRRIAGNESLRRGFLKFALLIPNETYMRRCLELALLGSGHVAPNPMVGAVLVYEDRIIGEGYHELYGKAHAEVNCIASVKPEDQPLIPLSTIYVSLEPCAHHGKTPPCADLIVARNIPRVVVGCRDPFPRSMAKGSKNCWPPVSRSR